MLVRDSFSSSSTDGVLFVDSRPFCHTLEPAQGKKVKYGKGCCIAPGNYSIDFHYSPKFGKYMLTLRSVIVTGKQIGRASCRERVSSPV